MRPSLNQRRLVAILGTLDAIERELLVHEMRFLVEQARDSIGRLAFAMDRITDAETRAAALKRLTEIDKEREALLKRLQGGASCPNSDGS